MRESPRRVLPHIAVILAAWLAPGAALAQQIPDYFPLQVGNQWVYRSVYFQGFDTVGVSGTRIVNGTNYSVVLQNSDPATATLYRNDGAGKIYRLDPVKQQETLAWDFTVPASSPVLGGPPYTIATAGHYSGPLGTFDTAFSIGQLSSLSGSTDTFLPYIGKVASTSFLQGGSASLVPPLVENLIYARIGNILAVTTRDWGFGITLDRPVYQLQFGQTDDCQGVAFPGWTAVPNAYSPCALVRLTLRLFGNDPLHLSFPTQQLYELELRDAAGNLVWRLSDNKTFSTAPRDLVVGSGEVNFVELIPLYRGGTFPPSLLAPGSYRLTATLKDSAASASASVALTVTR